jgi:hypothetical protein
MENNQPDFTMPRWTEAQIVNIRRNLRFCMASFTAVASIALFFLSLYKLAEAMGAMPQPAVVVLFAALSIFLSSCGILLVFQLTPALNHRRYAWVQKEQNQHLGRLCAENPGLRHYRNLLMAEGRPVMVKEYLAMRAWVARQSKS